MTCEEFKDAVTDYLEGALSAERRHGFEHHGTACAACARYLHELQQTIFALGQLGPTTPPAALRARVLSAYQRRWAAAGESASALFGSRADPRASTGRSRSWLNSLEALRRRYSTWTLLGLTLVLSLLLSLTSGPRVEIHRPGLPRVCLLIELIAGLLPASALSFLCWRGRQRISVRAFAIVAGAGAITGQISLFMFCPMLDARVHALVIHSTGVFLAILLGVLVGCLPVPSASD